MKTLLATAAVSVLLLAGPAALEEVLDGLEGAVGQRDQVVRADEDVELGRVQALDRLRDVLSRCEANFAAMSRPGEGETVRGYAYARSEVVQSSIRRYEENLREFFTALGIYVSPAGSNPRATSG